MDPSQTSATGASPHNGHDDGAWSERLNRLQQQSREIQGDIEALANGVEAVLADVGDLLREELRRRPYATLAAASGLGYVLGGGIPRRVVRVLLEQGGRLALTVGLSKLVAAGARETEGPA